jgi:hypothetical protein
MSDTETEQAWVDGWVACYHDLWDTFVKANPKARVVLVAERDELRSVMQTAADDLESGASIQSVANMLKRYLAKHQIP